MFHIILWTWLACVGINLIYIMCNFSPEEDGTNEVLTLAAILMAPVMTVYIILGRNRNKK